MTGAAPIEVIANPTAGGGKAGRLIGKVDAILRSLRVEHRVRVTGSPPEVEEAARSLAADGAPIVAVLGGDGTVSWAANGLVGTSTALAVLPGGTGDDFAKAIGAGTFEPAVRLLAAPHVRPVDTIEVKAGAVARHFVNVAGAGFDSEVNETANAMRVRLGGTATYVAALVKTLSRFTPAHYEIAVDDTMISTDAMLAVVGNGFAYGGGMKVLPSAVLDDGELDVCVVEALGKGAFLRAFPRVYRGTHDRHPKVRMFRGRHVRVEASRRMPVYADGELVAPLPAVFEIRPATLPVVVGPDPKGLR